MRHGYPNISWPLLVALIALALLGTGCESPATGDIATGPPYWSEILEREPAFKVRLQAALLLGGSGDPRALRALSRCAEHDEHPAVRRGAVDALVTLNRPGAIVTLIAVGARDLDPLVRMAAIEALKNFDRLTHQRFIIAAFDSDDVPVRAEALRQLPLPLSDLARRMVVKALGDFPEIFDEAKELVATLQRERRMDWLTQAASDANVRVRVGAVRLLGQDASARAAAHVVDIFERENEALEVKEEAGHSLRSLQEHLVVGDFLRDATQHSEPHMRMRAIRILEAIQGRGAIRVLVMALSDSAAPVRGRAALALGQLDVIAALPKLEEMLQNPLNQTIAPHLTQAMERLRAAMDSQK